MTLMARWSGTCPECGGMWQHATCPDTDDLTPTNPVCQTCWPTHPEGACDR